MSSLKQYALIFAGVNGTLLAEEVEVDVTRTTNAIPVSTVAGGYSGDSPGAGMVEIDIQEAVPSAGFEFDAGRYMMGLIPISVQVRGPGGKTLKGQAMIYQDSVRHGVNQPARYDFRCRMPLTLFT